MALHKNADDLNGHLQDLYQKEMDQLTKSLAKFELPDGHASMSNEELNYLMLHYVLQITDDVATSKEGLDFPFLTQEEAEESKKKSSEKKQASAATNDKEKRS